MIKLFVYGTLKKDNRNSEMMETSKFVGDGVIYGYELYANKKLPMLTVSEDEDAVVSGEVYVVTQETLQKLDKICDYPAKVNRGYVMTKHGKALTYYVDDIPEGMSKLDRGEW